MWLPSRHPIRSLGDADTLRTAEKGGDLREKKRGTNLDYFEDDVVINRRFGYHLRDDDRRFVPLSVPERGEKRSDGPKRNAG